MNASEPADTGAEHERREAICRPPAFLAHHFFTAAQQLGAARLGMWIFIATEILMFGGLFCAYAVWRGAEPEVFDQAPSFSKQTTRCRQYDRAAFQQFDGGPCGAIGAEWASHGDFGVSRGDDRVRLRVLGREVFRVFDKIHLGLLPGHCFGHPDFSSAIQGGRGVGTCLRLDAAVAPVMPEWLRALDESGHIRVLPPRANMFFGLYFVMTGLHGIHVLVGIGVLSWVLARNLRGSFSKEYCTPVDLGALYWHLVDLVWIYLFPLLYLVGRPE